MNTLRGIGNGLIHIFDSWMTVIDDLLEPKFIIGLVTYVGFFLIVWRVIGVLDSPPASELFTLVNLVLGVVLGVGGYFFGVQQGKNQGPPQP